MFSNSMVASITRPKSNVNKCLDLSKFETLKAKAFIMIVDLRQV